ncbi:efflux RND transporter permease subunit [Microcoleus asticus]|uniref:Multidrug resistance protein MdtC n=1 Tax=Microcoleus asticus IPMA8 TaxID=2563858 RepID=A0ABX2CXC2_9CYAN|nr:efflux RND transporter permease subunit [Microcoleus asticus]NQE34230.1 Multidrug resistance protein MdtC [Microcoleus asticus IPMA8]
MSFNISAWSIKQPVPTIVLFLVLTIGGLLSFPLLGIDDSPNIDVPSVSISVSQPGADPAELESQVTKKVEDAVAGLGNIDHIISTVNDGSSNTTVNFLLGTNSDRATNDVRNAIAQIRQSLPQDINDPVVKRVEFAGSSIMSYAVVSDRQTVEQLSELIDQNISRVLLSVKGVAQVQRIGGRDRDIRVDLNPEQLQSLGITATQVNDQIRNFNINLPGGRTEIGNSEQTVRTLGSAKTIEQLKAYQITLPKGGFVPLSTLGEVGEGYAEARQAARLNNKPVVAFSILRSTGSTLVTVEEAVRETVKKLEKTLPPDVKLELIYTLADHIRDSYEASVDALILGAALAVITILIFLRDWRATLIASVALPLSAIPTFAVLRLLGYTLNSMTLLALSLVVGILVDDAIVEIENIERHVGMGKTPYQASLDASAEIGLAVVATTMTIVAVFAPVAFMPGIPGQFFRPFGVTVSASVLFSLLVARTVTPMMAAYLFKEKGHHQELKKDQLSYQYRRLLTWALKHRAIVLILGVALFFGSVQLIPYIPTGFIDRDDTGLSTVSIELPPGSTLQQTDSAVQQATQLLLAHPAVDSVLETEGAPTVSGGAGGGGGASGVNTASLYVKLKPADKRIGQQRFEEEMRPKLRDVPGVRLSFAQGRVGGRKQMSIVLKSENAEALTNTAEALTQQMRQVPGLIEVQSSASLVKPEILVKPDPNRAADQGVSVQQIARTASLATIGDIDSNLAKFDLPDRQIPIHVMLAPQFRSDIETIKNLQVPAKNNTLVPLRAVADIALGSGPSQIDRYDRARQVSVEGNLLQGTTLGEASVAVKKLPAMNPLPPGVEQESSGDAKVMQDVFSGFAGALGTAVLFIYAVLVLLFANFLHPVTIMAALPLSLGGALLGLLVGQKSLGLYALIGVVLLMGIVTKNSILLVDYAIMNQQEGKPMYEATLDSGVARLRPILMTTIAMIAGMVPIALGIGAGSQTRSPMAMAVIGGLMTSTLLTLVVIPVVFTYMDGLQIWIFNLMRGKKRGRRAIEGNIESQNGRVKIGK